ncbi:hypothetical protein DERF_001654, partial [Dermatophagoides farinae]
SHKIHNGHGHDESKTSYIQCGQDKLDMVTYAEAKISTLLQTSNIWNHISEKKEEKAYEKWMAMTTNNAKNLRKI